MKSEAKKIISLTVGTVFLFGLFVGPALAYLPSDPLYNLQSYLKQINIEPAWETAKGDNVVVAVIDSGVDIDNPDLKINIWKNIDETPANGIDDDHNSYVDDISGWDFIHNSADPRPKFDQGYDQSAINHGTAIAGLIAAAANNDKGIAGVAFNAKIMPLRILDQTGSGDVENLIRAIDYAAANGADIVNMSLVGYDYSENLLQAIRRAYDRGVILVASAGNTDSSINGINLDLTPAYPACYGNNSTDNISLAVSSVGAGDARSTFSNYGLSCIDLTAPGEKINSLAYYYPIKKEFASYYSYDWSGTSFSTALVSGVAALVKSKFSFLKNNQVIETILNNTDSIDYKNPIFINRLGRGRLNAAKALSVNFAESQRGRLIKLANLPAVYYLDYQNKRHLFVNETTYWSWFSGVWRDQKIETISQSEFDGLINGKNITVRPGTNLIRFENSPRLYLIGSGGIIHYGAPETLAVLFGANYEKRVAIIQNGFENDYVRGEDLTNYKYPAGSLIQYAGGEDVWYIDNNIKRQVDSQGFVTNSFKDEYVVRGVSQDIFYQAGKSISDWESLIFSYATND